MSHIVTPKNIHGRMQLDGDDAIALQKKTFFLISSVKVCTSMRDVLIHPDLLAHLRLQRSQATIVSWSCVSNVGLFLYRELECTDHVTWRSPGVLYLSIERKQGRARRSFRVA